MRTHDLLSATTSQIRTIAQLCQALRIREAVEEYPMTEGQAGWLIRKLEDRVTTMRKASHFEANATKRNKTQQMLRNIYVLGNSKSITQYTLPPFKGGSICYATFYPLLHSIRHGVANGGQGGL